MGAYNKLLKIGEGKGQTVEIAKANAAMDALNNRLNYLEDNEITLLPKFK